LFPSTIASAVSVVVVLSSAEALFLFLNHFSSHSSQQLLCTFSLFLSTIASAVSLGGGGFVACGSSFPFS
jgi:hypothetical protein